MKCDDLKRRATMSVTPLIGAALLTLCCCSGTYQARSVETSGFLGDYSKMRKGESGEALLVYVAPDVDLSSYSKIMMDPVEVYSGADGDLGELAPDELQAIVNYLDARLREELGTDYALVKEKGPDVLRLRVAITDAKASSVLLDTVSSVVPFTLAASSIKRLATGSHLAVGQAGVESEVQDSVTGKRLLAAVDRRIGRKYTGKFDKFEEWHAAEEAFDYWAGRLKERLAEFRAGAGS